MEYSVVAADLTKKFGDFTAVDHVNFHIRPGEVYGFLGANGAGKSTTIRMLCGLLEPTEGTAVVGGFDIRENPEKVKEIIGYMSQRFSLYEDLSVEQNINFFGGVYGLSNSELKSRKSWVLEMAGLKNMERMLTRSLPGGWKQRLALGCAMLHQPRILFLDEPTSGVDPIMRRNFWEVVAQLSDEEVTVLVTTHYLEEAEYCNDIMLIDAGRIIATGTPHELKTKHLTSPLLEVECSPYLSAMEVLERQPWIRKVTVFGTYLHLAVHNELEARRQLPSVLEQNGIKLVRVDVRLPSLEDVFIYLLEQEDQPA
jgi:ABC-2 type transport system ATP-binding protein